MLNNCRKKTVWMLFIEYELGNPDSNELQCIMIFEAHRQLLLKKWHSSYGFLSKSKKANTLTPAQGGRRAEGSAGGLGSGVLMSTRT